MMHATLVTKLVLCKHHTMVIAGLLQEFWGRRYNLVISGMLADCVYLPIAEGRWVAMPRHAAWPASTAADAKQAGSSSNNSSSSSTASAAGHMQPQQRSGLRQALALMSTFTASGVIHELTIW
jgi:hypothetical protein